VLRGGSWNNNASNCRVANRNNNNPDNRNNNYGFRLANTGDYSKFCSMEQDAV
jgi:formylglycine-generating enzyme required for sulfatase activity